MSAKRWLVPEVVQTSMMDCGPAALTSLLAGFGITASYGRLREACHTEVDGTSIDTIEEVAKQLGLDADQMMIPRDHLFRPESGALPALVVVRQPNGFTHFIVVWSIVNGIAQCMDPAVGRRWISVARLEEELFIHEVMVPLESFRDWALSDDFIRPLERRISDLGATRISAEMLEHARADVKQMAALDAATRLVASTVAAGGLSRGDEAGRVLVDLARRALAEPLPSPGELPRTSIPDPFWTARPADDDHVILRGAVLMSVKGRRAAVLDLADVAPLPSELVAALEEPPARPARRWLALVREDGLVPPLAFGVLLVLAALATAADALLFRGMLDVGHSLGPREQRIAGVFALLAFVALGTALDWAGARSALGLGRRLETRLRMAFLRKMPRIEDAYFQSRATSDMAARCHSIEAVRGLPSLGGRFLRGVLELLATCAGIAWLDPAAALPAIGVVASSIVVPLLAMPILFERDLRARVHSNAMATFFFDAMRGLAPIRTHGAERSVRREHETLLAEWARAARAMVRPAIATQTVAMVLSYGLTVFMVLRHLATAGEPGAALLLLYWALTLPVIGQELAQLVQQYPAHINNTIRLLEPLGARESDPADHGVASPRKTGGVAISLANVSVIASGQPVITNVNAVIAAGEKVAIVGASGSGKSTFVGLLLGWHRPSAGEILVDGEVLDPAGVARLRADTAWVDPAVQLWNRSLHQNLAYGKEGVPTSLGAILDTADLHGVLESLPDGLATTLGESGALVSGGEGQRVRFGRALLRADARLAILDEPFRGLDRGTRSALAERSRAWWPDATMLFVTHDVMETRAFDRVLVVDGGTIVEQGHPEELLASDTLYRRMIDTEARVHGDLWGNAEWRRVHIEAGRLVEA